MNHTTLVTLAKWWLQPSSRKYWFTGMNSANNGVTDKIVYEKCQSIGIQLTTGLQHFINLDILIDEKSVLDQSTKLSVTIGYIILHDQIIRHLIRYTDFKSNELTELSSNVYLKQFKYHSQLAYDCANRMQLYNKHENIQQLYNMMGPAAIVFAIMPLRHIKHDSLTTRLDMEKIAVYWSLWLSNTAKSDLHMLNTPSYIKSFYLACLQQYAKTYTEYVHTRQNAGLYKRGVCIPVKIDNTILDKIWCSEYNPDRSFRLPYKSIYNNTDNDIIANNSMDPVFYQTLIDMVMLDTNITHLVLSVSGGVDSMVLTIAAIMAISNIWQTTKRNIALSLVHINYGNRDTAGKEETLVRRFVYEINCRQNWVKYYLDIGLPAGFRIKLLVSWPGEIIGKRENAPYRDIYESVTRELRFNAYKHAIALHTGGIYDSLDQHQLATTAVLLGHNSDDVLENVLRNIADGKYSNLGGMSSIGLEMDVTIWRPLLNIPKQLIYEEAQKLNIPHVYDSTPKWSVRGQLRDNVIPVLDKVLPTFKNGALGLVKTMNTYARNMSRMIDKVIQVDTKTEMEKINYNLDTDILLMYDSEFMYNVLLKICKRHHIRYPKHTTVSSMYENLQQLDSNYPEKWQFTNYKPAISLKIKRTIILTRNMNMHLYPDRTIKVTVRY